LSSFKSCLTNSSVCWFLFLASTRCLFLSANRFFLMAAHVSSSSSSSSSYFSSCSSSSSSSSST
jgi:hypothetical protein